MITNEDIINEISFEICYNYSQYNIDTYIMDTITEILEKDYTILNEDDREYIFDTIRQVILSRLYTNNRAEIESKVIK